MRTPGVPYYPEEREDNEGPGPNPPHDLSHPSNEAPVAKAPAVEPIAAKEE